MRKQPLNLPLQTIRKTRSLTPIRDGFAWKAGKRTAHWLISRKRFGLIPIRLQSVREYCTIVLLTWTGRSPFDLLIRLNPLGRLALSRKQINASNWVGACFIGIFVSVALGVIYSDPLPIAASGCFAMLAILGAGMARGKGNLRKLNTFCAITYAATVLLEAAGMVLRDPMYWAALFCLLIILLPGIGYIWITERIRRTHEV